MGLPGPSWNWLTEPISNHALLCHVMVVLPAWLLSCMLVRVMHPVVTTWRPSSNTQSWWIAGEQAIGQQLAGCVSGGCRPRKSLKWAQRGFDD